MSALRVLLIEEAQYNMKIFLYSFKFFALCITIFSDQNSAENHLVAVSSLVGSESFYVNIRKRRLGKLIPYASYPTEEPNAVKEGICADILGSALFNSYGVDPINPYLPQKYPTVYEDLKHKYPSIYENLYMKYPNDTGFKNPYQKFNVTITPRSVYQEYMFVCLARKRKSKDIVKYFISRKYNVNEYIRHTARRIEGRFVFIMNERKRINVFALAEEAAHQSFDQNTIEGVYMEYVKKRVRPNVHEIDPLCALTKARKVRLCTIILNAVECQRNISFFPDQNNIEPECDRKTLTFKYKKKAGSPKEWMIGCKAKLVSSGQPITYYISRGYRPSTCYVYRELNGQTVFDHLSSDVGVYLMAKTYTDPV